MPTNKEEQQERRRAAIISLLGEKHQIRHQKALVGILKAMGVPATQASVSRDLRELGAVWVDGHYELPSWDDEEVSPFQKVVRQIVKVKAAGPHLTLIVTKPGAGGAVAEAIEADGWEDIIGTVAGYSSVLVLTEIGFFQGLVFERIKGYFDSELGEEEHEALQPESQSDGGAKKPEETKE
jgi:transcriptional regulator of arginine metabolism